MQGNYVYYSLQDFYTDANGYLANPNRTTSPVGLRYFKQRYSNLPGLDEPLQELKVWYGGAYAQDEWRPRPEPDGDHGPPAGRAVLREHGLSPTPRPTALTFRDEDGSPVQYSTGSMPDPKILWSPRVGDELESAGKQRTQVRGGTGVFTGPPLYVWISNQLGNTGVLIGEIIEQQRTYGSALTTRRSIRIRSGTGRPT